jgi:Zn-dependent protease
LGRITLNPLKHVDPIGTIVFPVLLAVMGVPILGWAKPVPFVLDNLRVRRWGPALVGVSGPMCNFLLTVLAAALLLVLKRGVPDFELIMQVPLTVHTIMDFGVSAPLVLLPLWFAIINLMLGVFNIIPIPPLDGSHLVEAALPPRWARAYAELRPFGIFILFIVVYVGLFGKLLRPVFGLFSSVLLGS